MFSNNSLLDDQYPSCYGLVIRWEGSDDEYMSKEAKLTISVRERGFWISESINAKYNHCNHNSIRITTSLWRSASGTYIEWPIFQAINNIFGEEGVELIKLSIIGYPIQE